MAYPADKETFRRVVNQDLPAVEGDIVDEDDQNLPADFLERLQDTLGYNLLGGFGTLKLRLDNIDSKFPFKSHTMQGTFSKAITAGAFATINFAQAIPITNGDKVIAKLSGIIKTNANHGGSQILSAYQIDGGLWNGFGGDPFCDNTVANFGSPFCYTLSQLIIGAGSTIKFKCVGNPGNGNGTAIDFALEVFVI